MRDKKLFLILCAFIVILLSYAFLTTRVGLTDTAEFIVAAKEFAGLNTTNLYIYHSFLYSFILGLFLKILPSIIFIKILNSLWLILIGFLLYKISNNKKALILWIFCPLVYYMSILISPILACSFFLFLAYYLLKKYENTNKIKYFIFSALSLGVLPAFRFADIIFMALFIIIFLFNEKFNKILLYLFFCSVTFSSLFIINAYYYGLPYYTVILYIGGQFLNAIGITKFDWFSLRWFVSLFIISPLWFLMFRKENKKEAIFIILSFLYISLMAHYRLLLSIAPFVILLLSKSLKKKMLVINCAIAFILIIILTYNYFGNNEDNILKNDLINLEKDFEERIFVTSDGGAYFFPALYWNDFHYIWLRDYTLYKQNKTLYNTYTIKSRPTIRDAKIVEINVDLHQNNDPIIKTIDERDLLFIFNKREFEYDNDLNLLTITFFARGWQEQKTKLSDMKLVKCYNLICVFKRL